ncbi:MAG TPA: head maturation protease, ClpP-related [Terriglobales bacterium]|jgi:ATP-dependent protease ClpP protease subunit|nr:head maturation protease, ClpP-related [Terriglobales bacterium]
MFSLRKDKPGTTAFSAKASGKTLQLNIFDAIGEDFFGEGITASSVKNALGDGQEDYSDIELNLNSPGGDLFEGVAIYNLLKSAGKPVNVNVLGLAASAASLIAMAGTSITMQLGTQMMIHEGLALAVGHADDMRKMADTLESVTASAADIYVARTGLSKDTILSMLKDETWMNPEQAKANGFATAISEKKSDIKSSFNLSVFKNTPAELTQQENAEEDYTIFLRLKRIEVEKRK